MLKGRITEEKWKNKDRQDYKSREKCLQLNKKHLWRSESIGAKEKTTYLQGKIKGGEKMYDN